MSKKLVIAVFGLVVLCASLSWAGTTGNGWAQRNAAAGLPSVEAKTKYEFCYAGNPRVVYISQVITLPLGDESSFGDVAYSKYIQVVYRLPAIDRDRCVTGYSEADVAAEKERYKGMFGRAKLIEIKWGR